MNPFKVPSRALTLNRVPASRRQTPASGNNKANSPASAYNKANKDILAPDNNRASSSSSLQEDHIDDSVINSNTFTAQEFKLSAEQLLRQEGYAQQTKDIDNYFERILNPQDKKSDGIITAEMITNPQVVAAYMKFKEEGNDLLKKMKRVKEFKDLDTDTEIVNLEVEVDKYKFINIKSYKHIIENFLHTLTQNNIPLWTYGPVFQSDTPLIHFIKTEFGFYKIGTISKSTNMRILWGQALLSLLMLEFIDTVQRYSVIDFQMESPKQPVEDTLPETEVTKVAQNTIITQEQDDTTNVHIEENSNLLQEISTTEQLSNLAPIAERFVRIFDSTQVFNITDTFNQQIFSLTIPNGLYAHLDSTIVSALRSFTLLKTDVELLVKINANQAQCGRYIMSHF
nr:L+VP2 [Opsiphanes invirae iflavirus 1]